MSKFLLFVWLLVSQQLLVHAQNTPTTDSLLRVLKNSPSDTNRITILGHLSQQCMYTDPQQAYAYSQQALVLANKVHNAAIKGRVLCQVGIAYLGLNKYEEAVQYLNQCITLAKQSHDKHTLARAYNNLGNVYDIQDPQKSLPFYLTALRLYEELHDRKYISYLLSNVSSAYYDKGEYVKAVSYGLKALKLAEQNADSSAVARITSDVGVAFEAQGNLPKAKEYYLKSLAINQQINDMQLLSVNLTNLGGIYEQDKNDAKALECYQKAVTIEEETDDRQMLSASLIRMANIYSNQHKFELAIGIYQKVLGIVEETHYQRGIAEALYALGETYQKSRQYEQALPYLRKSMDLAQQIELKETMLAGYQMLSETYQAMGQYSQALHHYQQYAQLKDSLLNAASLSKMNELQVQYETEKKESKIKVLSQQTQIQQLTLSQQRIYLLGLLALLTVGGLAAYLMIRQNTLQANQRSLEFEQKFLRMQMSPHFIFNALTAIQNVVYQYNPAKAGQYLAKFAKLMRLILENSRQEYVTLDNEITTLEHYLLLQQLRFQHNFEYSIYVDPSLNPEETAVPPMFAQPLIENSLEHGLVNKSEKGLIQIRFLREGELLLFEVEDNGVGRQRAAQLQAQKAPTHQSMATHIIQERLVLLNRRNKHRPVKLQWTDLVGADNTVQGTKATFSIPFTVI
jgi:tetratricopeptide (TPR) repeat protein